MPRDAVSRTANVERTGRHKWVNMARISSIIKTYRDIDVYSVADHLFVAEKHGLLHYKHQYFDIMLIISSIIPQTQQSLLPDYFYQAAEKTDYWLIRFQIGRRGIKNPGTEFLVLRLKFGIKFSNLLLN